MKNDFHIFPYDSIIDEINCKAIENFWNDDDIISRVKPFDLENYFIKYIKPNINISTNSRILDIGCGNGDNTSFLGKYFNNKVDACDLSQKVINSATKRHPDILFKKNSLRKLPYEDGSFDFVFLAKTFSVIPDIYYMKIMIEEISRILKSNGYILIIDFCYNKNFKNEYKKIQIDDIQYYFLKPQWSSTPFIHLKSKDLQNLFYKFKLIMKQDIIIKTINEHDEDGRIYLFNERGI